MRKEKLADLIISELELIDIKEGELMLITLPSGLSGQQSNAIGQGVVDALRGLGKDNPVLLMPEGIGLHAINEDDMKELGWIRDAKSRKHNIIDDRDKRTDTSTKESIDQPALRQLWKSVMANLARKAERGEESSTATDDDLSRRRPASRSFT